MGERSSNKGASRQRRRARIRKHVEGTATRPRLSVFRSARHVYAQIIDDITGTTLAAASSLGEGTAAGKKAVRAETVGGKIAAAALARDIQAVVFDRNGFRYHGRVRAIAEAARAGGLKF